MKEIADLNTIKKMYLQHCYGKIDYEPIKTDKDKSTRGYEKSPLL